MGRRYLTDFEIWNALHRGKAVEAFIGPCSFEGEKGIKWLSINKKDQFQISIFVSSDFGHENNLDLYSFGPLDPDLESDEPNEQIVFDQIEDCLHEIEIRFPESRRKLVNEFGVQDEYLDFIQNGRK